MKIDVVKGKATKTGADADSAAETEEQKTTKAVDQPDDDQAGGQAKEPPADEQLTLSGFYHLMWDTQMVR